MIYRVDKRVAKSPDQVAEDAVWNYLEKNCPHEWVILCGVPKRGRRLKDRRYAKFTETDAIVIAHQLIFVIEIKSHSGTIRIKDASPWQKNGIDIVDSSNHPDGFWKHHVNRCYGLRDIGEQFFGIESRRFIPKFVFESDCSFDFGSSEHESDILKKQEFVKDAISRDARSSNKWTIIETDTARKFAKWLADEDLSSQIPERNSLSATTSPASVTQQGDEPLPPPAPPPPPPPPPKTRQKPKSVWPKLFTVAGVGALAILAFFIVQSREGCGLQPKCAPIVEGAQALANELQFDAAPRGTATYVNLRETPGLGSGVITSVQPGTRLIATHEAFDPSGVRWYRVRSPDGTVGYVKETILTKFSGISAWVAVGRSQSGTTLIGEEPDGRFETGPGTVTLRANFEGAIANSTQIKIWIEGPSGKFGPCVGVLPYSSGSYWCRYELVDVGTWHYYAEFAGQSAANGEFVVEENASVIAPSQVGESPKVETAASPTAIAQVSDTSKTADPDYDLGLRTSEALSQEFLNVKKQEADLLFEYSEAVRILQDRHREESSRLMNSQQWSLNEKLSNEHRHKLQSIKIENERNKSTLRSNHDRKIINICSNNPPSCRNLLVWEMNRK